MTQTNPDWRDVHAFWFPPGLEQADAAAHLRMFDWWLRGGSNAELPRFLPLVQQALLGGLDHWAETATGRLALILVLDQFPRGLFGGTPNAYLGDRQALRLSEESLRNGHCDELTTPWENIFMLMPLVHAEGPGHAARARRAMDLARLSVEMAPARLLPIYRASLLKGEEHRDVIARFGRFPHRNGILGRPSTPEEMDYLVDAQFAHATPLVVS
jgi:uncharacterized protein (DUF924 family)